MEDRIKDVVSKSADSSAVSGVCFTSVALCCADRFLKVFGNVFGVEFGARNGVGVSVVNKQRHGSKRMILQRVMPFAFLVVGVCFGVVLTQNGVLGKLTQMVSSPAREFIGGHSHYDEGLRQEELKLRSILKEVEKMTYRLQKQGHVKAENVGKMVGTGGLGGGRVSHSSFEFRSLVRQGGKPELIAPIREEDDLLVSISHLSDVLRKLPIGSPVFGDVSSGFGVRVSPFTGGSQFHSGLDFPVDHGSSVSSTGEGSVIYAGYYGGYGQTVIVDHGFGYQTLYAHLSDIQAHVGDSVCRGRQIGLVGNTGNSTGSHLHYEVRYNNQQIDPAEFVELAGVVTEIL